MQRKKKKNISRSLVSFLCLPLCAALAVILPRIAAAQNDTPTVEQAVRFLEQASFGVGGNFDEVRRVQRLGFAGYLDDPVEGQFYLPPSGWADRGLCRADPPTDTCTPTRDWYNMYPVQQEFFVRALRNPDQLRQRVVFALDQMWVTSAQLQGNFQAAWMDYYLQTLENNAFGNWRQLMEDVTLQPTMGKYLDMAGNRFVSGRAANENYAREILQLFNVGLDELMDDGTPILDTDGNRIPTYTQDVVIGFSKVFTGWQLRPALPRDDPSCHGSGQCPAPPGGCCPNWKDPMIPDSGRPDLYHDHTDKLLLDGFTLQGRPETDPSCADAGGCIFQDLKEALDNIFNNHNVPPLVCKNFIQYLVTSNPSPGYVSRCVAAFKGPPRGDMKAMLRAILLDDEARGAPGPDFGKLREPVLAITNILRNFNVSDAPCADTGYACTDYVLGESFIPAALRGDEDIFRSPTVFNFFPPNFVITGDTALYGPEFALQSTTTTLARVNLMNALVYYQGGSLISPSADRPTGTHIDPAELASYAPEPRDDGQMLLRLNTLMMHGTMSTDMLNLILSEISGVADPTMRAKKAVYLIATSSSYNVQR